VNNFNIINVIYKSIYFQKEQKTPLLAHNYRTIIDECKKEKSEQREGIKFPNRGVGNVTIF